MVKMKPGGFTYLIGGLLLVALGLAVGVPKLIEWHRVRERGAVFDEMVRPLWRPPPNDEGFWVGDVADLYQRGIISRELAEADTAPLNPLVPRPVPFHGYFVRALESGPPMTSDAPTPFLGEKGAKVYAFCIYPAEAGTLRYSYVVCPFGLFRKYDAGNQPQLKWFTPADRMVWAIVD